MAVEVQVEEVWNGLNGRFEFEMGCTRGVVKDGSIEVQISVPRPTNEEPGNESLLKMRFEQDKPL